MALFSRYSDAVKMYLAADGNLEQIARTPDRFSLGLRLSYSRCRSQKFRPAPDRYPLSRIDARRCDDVSSERETSRGALPWNLRPSEPPLRFCKANVTPTARLHLYPNRERGERDT